MWAQNVWIAEKDIIADKLKIQSRLNDSLLAQFRSNKRSLFIYKMVAILAFPIAVALSFLFYSNFESGRTGARLTEVAAPIGHIASCKLPDGSTVWINSGSSIRYNTTDFDSREREITLDGEAYFKVAKNKKVPFFVRTPIADVRVTGTSFNVKAIADKKVFETVLSEGSVLLFPKNRSNEPVKLSPGEKAAYQSNRKMFEIQKVDAKLYSSWRNGEIIFKDATLLDLMQELERVYGIEFQFDSPDLADFRFRGMFSYNNNLIDVLERIKSTSRINYRIENKKVWLSKMN
jgi:ferric-dicitrate binding protein FerR (iron transport regulator)